MTNPNDIAAELERAHAQAAKYETYDGAWDEFNYCARNHHATIIAALRSAGEVERLREALRWYAEEGVWHRQMWTEEDFTGQETTYECVPADEDRGERARRALGGAKE